MISTYRLPSDDPVNPNRNIQGNKYYFRKGLAKELVNMTDKTNPHNCTLNPPPIPSVCTETGQGNGCKFGNGSLQSCNTLTSNYVCKERQTKAQRGNQATWGACPYVLPNNWRYQYTIDSSGTVTKCSPPQDGTNNYKGNIKYGPKYYLQLN